MRYVTDACLVLKVLFSQVTESVIRLFASAYPELVERKSYVTEVVRNEEERFADTLGKGLGLLEQEIKTVRQVVARL